MSTVPTRLEIAKKEFLEFVSSEIAYYDRGWEHLASKLDSLVSLVRASTVQEAVAVCECLKWDLGEHPSHILCRAADQIKALEDTVGGVG